MLAGHDPDGRGRQRFRAELPRLDRHAVEAGAADRPLPRRLLPAAPQSRSRAARRAAARRGREAEAAVRGRAAVPQPGHRRRSGRRTCRIAGSRSSTRRWVTRRPRAASARRSPPRRCGSAPRSASGRPKPGSPPITHSPIGRRARLLAEVEDLLRRGIDCGALIDPWNILGYQGLFPIFPGREDTVRDPRAEELIQPIGRQFDLYAKATAARRRRR